MRCEYLLFDLAILLPPLALSLAFPAVFAQRWGAALTAIAAAALPFIAWDALVAGRHWWFNEAFVLGPRIAGLPIEEVLFFVSVPFACLFTWQSAFTREAATGRPRLRWLYALPWLAAPLGVALFATGREYTGLTLLALAAVAGLDRLLATGLLLRPHFLGFLVAVLVLTTLCNGYLTWRPVVLYEPRYQLDFRVGTIPIEDFGYGIALVVLVVILYEARLRRTGGGPVRRWVARRIERRLGGYRQQWNRVDATQPLAVAGERSVAVIGAGLAGLTAALYLAERRFAVTLLERNPYLGGKIGAWTTTLPDGEVAGVEHGFHAFFRHYYNLRRFLAHVGADRSFVALEDYRILARDGATYSFRNIERTPLLNLFSLARHGVYRLRDVALGPAGREMSVFARYDPERTFAEFDTVSFHDFAERARLPASLRLVFNAFARAFFADARRLSMAELIKSFHAFYLSHDHGLIYDYPDGNYADTILAPIRSRLEACGARIRLGTAVEQIARDADAGLRVDGQRADYVVLAADAAAARRILERSPVLDEAPALREQIAHLRSGQRYAMWRLWLDRDSDRPLPVFVSTEKLRVLDSVSAYHRIDRAAADWARRHGGGVFELHCYALPDDVVGEDDVRRHFLDELHFYFPELQGARIRHQHLQIRDDFTAFHVGLARHRPSVESGVAGLHLAGDWVALPCPAMLMEAACTAGVLAANAVLAREGLQALPVYTVPPRGMLAGR
jgi:isorenieratene synthase